MQADAAPDDIAERRKAEAGFARWLVETGRLSTAAVERALAACGPSRTTLVKALARLGLLDEVALAEALAARTGLALVRRASFPPAAMDGLPVSAAFLREHELLPLSRDGGVLEIALADPLDPFPLAALRVATGLEVRPLVAVASELDAAAGLLDPANDDQAPAAPDGPVAAGGEDVQRLRDLASATPVIRLVNVMLEQAVAAGASDVHLEPSADALQVRLRIDGALERAEPVPAALQAAVLTRLKLIARLDIAERRLPQDGRIKIVVQGRSIDLRVSTIPMVHGEGVVLRILDRAGLALDLVALGLDAGCLAAFRSLLERPNGMVLVTGPTGSGKTSTLYAALAALRHATRKIVTVEDPVEYELAGISQIQIKPAIELSFARVLRAVLRHDPDVIMVGEIRDGETAQIAVQAALTGHLVLSTLHTNSAAGAVTRLIEMGIESYLIASTLNGVMGQRLVRRLCGECRVAYAPLPELSRRLALAADQAIGPAKLYRPVGCARCRGTGHTGRTVLAEVLTMTDPLRELVLRGAPVGAIEQAARAAGMRTLLEDGIAKARAGVASVEEVLQAAGSGAGS